MLSDFSDVCIENRLMADFYFRVYSNNLPLLAELDYFSIFSEPKELSC